jgi:hypothetical protein
MEKTQVARARRETPDERKRESLPFVSMCPKCAQMRTQLRYDLYSLRRLLERGHPVEAYCEQCDDFWSINVKERAGLAVLTLALQPGFTVICTNCRPVVCVSWEGTS